VFVLTLEVTNVVTSSNWPQYHKIKSFFNPTLLFAKWLVNFKQRNIYNSLIYLKVAFVVDILNALNEDLDINKLIIEER
jgi:hypothetical protein